MSCIPHNLFLAAARDFAAWTQVAVVERFSKYRALAGWGMM